MSNKTLRFAAGATSGLFLAGVLGGALVMAGGSAASAAAGATVPYTCGVASLAASTFNFAITATAPASVTPGGTVTLSGVQLSSAIPASVVTEIVNLAHISSFSGTVTTLDFNASGATPMTINAARSGISFTIPFVSGQAAPFTIPASPESVGPFTAGKSGTVTVSPGNVVITTVVGPLTYAITCTPPSSLPAGATLSVPVVTSGSTTTTTSAPTTTVSGPGSTVVATSSTTGVSVPASHTGEPWAGWPYWAIVALLGALSFISLELAFQRRRRRT
jgi:hypothetical protein